MSVDRFLARFKVDDVFWHMRRSLGEAPSHIEGPCTIIAISTSYKGVSAPPVVTFTFRPQLRRSGSEETKTMFVSDIVNQSHGAFANEKDAHVYLVEWQAAYRNDPDLIAALAGEKERIRKIQEIWMMSWKK